MDEGHYQTYDGFQTPTSLFPFSSKNKRPVLKENFPKPTETFSMPRKCINSQVLCEFREPGICYPTPVSGTFPTKNDNSCVTTSCSEQSLSSANNFTSLNSPVNLSGNYTLPQDCPAKYRTSKFSIEIKQIQKLKFQIHFHNWNSI